MRRLKPIDAYIKPMEDLVAALEKMASDLGPIENAANQELLRTLSTAIDALNDAKRIGNKN